MLYRFIYFALFLLMGPNLAYAEINPDKAFAFQKLQQATTAYGEKHDLCNQQKQDNKLTAETQEMLQALSEETLRKGMIYLSEKAFNRCLQPERGQLAERLLQIQSWPEDKKQIFDNLMLITMNATRKLVFDISRINTEVVFYQLPVQQQQKLLAISAMQTPFDMLAYWEASSRIGQQYLSNEK
ncbi:MAG: hypothetical protein ACJAT7_002966 [Psychromonas sp.]|jgi:hypothetical protein|uniref:hypothetical protein n=1 Tax=Psychromonas sp. TaxID=1884585 RepID=UPI0039E4F63A